MRRIAIFVEGQSELIFIRYILLLIFSPEEVNFTCMELRGKKWYQVDYEFMTRNPSIYFLIVNVGNDEKVLSIIREMEENLFSKGYESVIGVRDMYSEDYQNFSHKVDIKIIKRFVTLHNETINGMDNAERINLYFAVMEFESWLFAMCFLFEKINEQLTVGFIEENIGINLETTIPDEVFFHPANEMRTILKLIGSDYDKSEDQMNAICSLINDEDLLCAIAENGSPSFKDFYDGLG